MKRFTLLVAVAALGFGSSAFSQTQDGPRAPKQAPAAASPATKAEASGGPVQRATAATKRVATRSADAVRRTGQAVERKLPPAPANQQSGVVPERGPAGTGTGPSTATGSPSGMGNDRAGAGSDISRQARMDDAYSNWQRSGSSTSTSTSSSSSSRSVERR